MNTKEKYEDIKLSLINEKTRDTLEKIRRATKDFTVQNDKADAYVSAVHSKLKKEKPEGLRSEDKKPEPKKPEPKKTTTKPEPKPKPAPKPKPTKTAVKATTTKVNALTSALQNDPLLKGLGKTDKERDAGRTALPKGRRVSKAGWKNQYGSSKGGRVYYENRENHSDRKSHDYKDGYPYLAMGGYTHKNDTDGEFTVSTYRIIDGKKKLIQEKKYKDSDSAVTYAMMKGNFKGIGESIIVTDKDGKWLYKSISNKSKGGYMADGGMMDDEGVDLFEDYEDQPEEVSVILSNYELEDNDYDILEQLLAELEEIGYTFEYGLDGEPYDLRKIGKKGKSEFYAKGGGIKNQYEGREAEDIWNILSVGQRLHFLTDHNEDLNLKFEQRKEISRLKFDSLSKKIKEEFAVHVLMGQYAKGGYMANDELKKGDIVKFRDGSQIYILGRKGDGYDYKDGREKGWQGKGWFDMMISTGKATVKQKTMPKRMAEGGKIEQEMVIAKFNNAKDKADFKSDLSNVAPDSDFSIVDLDGNTVQVMYDLDNKEIVTDVLKSYSSDYYAKGGVFEKLEVGVYKVGKPIKVEPNLYEQKIVEIFANGDISTASDYGRKLSDFSGLNYPIISKEQLDAQYKMERGGYMAKGEDYEYKNTFKRFDSNVPVPQDDFKKFVDAWHKQNEGDILDKAKYKVLKQSMGNYLGHKTVQEMEDYVEKTHKVQRMAEGGQLRSYKTFVEEYPDKKIYVRVRFAGADKDVQNYTANEANKEKAISFAKRLAEKNNGTYEGFKIYTYAKGGYMADGGKIGFDALAAKVAKRYEGKKVPAKYQKEYGKTYDKQEAKEVGDKVAAKVYRQQQGKMADGGEILTFEEFKKQLPPVQSPFYGEEGIMYKPAYNRYSNRTMYYKNGRRAGKPISVKYAYEESYLYDAKKGKMAKGGEIKKGDRVRSTVFKDEEGEVLNKKGDMLFVRKDVNGKFKHDVFRISEVEKLADGGKLDQGFNDRLDESMGNRNGKEAKMEATLKDRRNESKGENKAVGKRPYSSVHTMDKMAEGGELGNVKLPHNLKKYFTKPAGTIEVEMNKLIPIRAREKGIANAERYMRLAYDGKMERRKPISIYKTRNGKYRIKDGNSTYAVAKKHNWKTIFAEVVENPNISKRKENSVFTVASKIRKDGESWASAVKRAGAMKK